MRGSSMQRERFFKLAVIVLCGIAAGLATAPLGVPMLSAALTGAKADFSALSSMIFASDQVAALLRYLSGLTQSFGGFCSLLLWCLVSGAAVGLALLCMYLNEADRSVREGVLGDAKLIEDVREIRRRNDFWETKEEPESAGLVLSSSRKGYIYDSGVPHFAIVGKTGSGKTWLINLQTLHLTLAKGWNLIITGKEELLELTGEKAMELGYSRVVFDLRGYPGASGFNPVGLIADYAEAGKIDMAQRTARQTAADLIPLGGESNTYFPKAARSALTACLLIVAMADVPREQKNMASVCYLVNRGTTGDGKDPSLPLKEFIRGESVGSDHPAYGAAADFLSDGGMTTAGKNVLSTLKEALAIFNDEGVRRITAKSDVSIRDMIREKTVIYMHLLEEGDPYMVLMTIFLNQWWRVAQEEARGNCGHLPRETAILGDEWGNLPVVSALPEIVTLGRSYRLHAYCFTQDLKQWNKYSRPGDQNAGRDKILGSMGGKVALSLASPEDFQYFTRLVGKRTVRTRSQGTSKQGFGPGSRAGSSDSYSERADDLIHEWEWQNRVPVRDGLICIKGGENSKPGREGVFRMPVAYASKTPAAEFFGLGDEAECDAKKARFHERMEAAAKGCAAAPVPCWMPDLSPSEGSPAEADSIADDEFSAWD